MMYKTNNYAMGFDGLTGGNNEADSSSIQMELQVGQQVLI